MDVLCPYVDCFFSGLVLESPLCLRFVSLWMIVVFCVTVVLVLCVVLGVVVGCYYSAQVFAGIEGALPYMNTIMLCIHNKMFFQSLSATFLNSFFRVRVIVFSISFVVLSVYVFWMCG